MISLGYGCVKVNVLGFLVWAVFFYETKTVSLVVSRQAFFFWQQNCKCKQKIQSRLRATSFQNFLIFSNSDFSYKHYLEKCDCVHIKKTTAFIEKQRFTGQSFETQIVE